MLAIFFVTAALHALNTVVVRPTVYVAQKVQSCPVTQKTEQGAKWVGEKVLYGITFGSYGQ